MVLANLCGINVFATGGLGGVHSGGESSMDISADLTELGRTGMAVVSSGCKSFLDIPRTLEYLETQGVCVATFADGRDDEVDFPAFWTRDSGSRSPMTIKDEKEAAAMICEYLGTIEGAALIQCLFRYAAKDASHIRRSFCESHSCRVFDREKCDGYDHRPSTQGCPRGWVSGQ